jgi:hypothetical protein
LTGGHSIRYVTDGPERGCSLDPALTETDPKEIDMAATILAFPARGGNGFNLLSAPKRKKIDHTNLALSLTQRQMEKEARERFPEEKAFALERTPELLIAMAIYKELDGVQQARVQMTVQGAYQKAGDEESRIAANILAAISLSDTKGERK